MKRITFFSMLLAVVFMTVSAQLVRIEKVWIDHNVFNNGQKGMKIHTKFTVDDFQGQTFDLKLMHYIEHSDGRELWGNTQNYCTIDRHGNPQATAMVGWTITPGYQYTTYDDWWVFMPYSALHCQNGKYNLRVVTLVHNTTHDRWCAKSAYYTPFTYSISNPKTYTPGTSGRMIDNTYMNDLNGNRITVPTTPAPSTPGSDYDRHKAKCSGCNGTGMCRHCNGSGKVNNYKSNCSLCHGTGRCQSCHGQGFIRGNF